MVTVTAIEHEDVRGKKLKYLKLTNGKMTLLINVGDKTYEGVKKMHDEGTEISKEEMQEEVKKMGGDDLAKAVEENNRKGGRKG